MQRSSLKHQLIKSSKDPPGAPSQLEHLLDLSTFTIAWTWQPPSSDATLLFYNLTMLIAPTASGITDPATSYTLMIGAETPKFAHVVTNGYSYTLQVSAITAAGTGQFVQNQAIILGMTVKDYCNL